MLLVGELEREIVEALDRIVDPCSVGRGVPAGMADMGLICGVEVSTKSAERADVRVTLRLTSPGCTFQMYFDQQVKVRLREMPTVECVEVIWNNDFNWSDDDLSPALKQRLRAKRELALVEFGSRKAAGS